MTGDRLRHPSVSVVIPAHNAGRYITECLESVASQRRGDTPFEVIVVDDGSTDDTCAKVRAFGGIQLISQENSGPSAARNRGVAAAKGELVAFLDSDDLWTEGKLDAQMALFRQHPEAGLVFGDCRIFDDTAQRAATMFESAGLDERFWGHPSLVKDAYVKLLRKNYIPTGAAMVRKSCLLEVGGFDPDFRYVEDLDMWLRIAMRYPIAYTTNVWELKRQHDENVSNDAEAMMLGYLDVLEKQGRVFQHEIRMRGIRIRQLVAMQCCLLGDRIERQGRIEEARAWYLKGFFRYPSIRPAFYWLRSIVH